MKKLSDIINILEFDRLDLIAKHIVEGVILGLHRSPYHGFSVEFAEHRIYNKGESTKHIDWKLFARTEKLFIKQFEEETNLRCQILLDTSSSMFFPYGKENKINFCVYCIAALTHILRKQKDAVGLSLFSDQLLFHTEPKLNNVHIQKIYAELEKIINLKKPELNQKTDLPNILHYIANTAHAKSLIIVFTDNIGQYNTEDLFSSLKHLKHNKHEIILFDVKDKNLENDLNLRNMPYRLIDMETGEKIKVTPNQVKNIYAKKIKEQEKEIELKCRQYSIDYIKADINKEFKEILIPYILKRKKL